MVPKQYRNCVIKAHPILLAVSKVWGVSFTISRPDGERSFTVPETYPGEREAVDRCFDLAARIIDEGEKGAPPDHGRST